MGNWIRSQGKVPLRAWQRAIGVQVTVPGLEINASAEAASPRAFELSFPKVECYIVNLLHFLHPLGAATRERMPKLLCGVLSLVFQYASGSVPKNLDGIYGRSLLFCTVFLDVSLLRIVSKRIWSLRAVKQFLGRI